MLTTAIGRVATHTSAIGTFTRSYLGYTNQLSSSLLSGSTIGTNYYYHQNGNDRLSGVHQQSSAWSGTRSYYLTTNAKNQVTEVDLNSPLSTGPKTISSWYYTYDDDGYRLLAATNSSVGNYQYTYDPVGNITAFNLPAANGTASYNAANQLFDLITGGSPTPLSYDSNGNLLNDGVYTYTWDAENRLLSATSNANASISTTFRYDGLGRRTVIIVSNSGKTTQTDYAWCGQTLCGSRSKSGTTVRLYYPEGEYFAYPVA